MKTIKFKTWVHMMTVVALIFILMWLFQVVFLQNFYEFSKERDVKKVQKQIVEILSQNPISESYDSLLKLSRENDLFVEVYDNNCNIVFNPFMFAKKPFNNHFNINDIIASYAMSSTIEEMIKSGKTTHTIKIDRKGDESSDLVMINQFINNDKSYFVATKTPLIPVQATSNILKRIFLIIFVVVFIASLLVSVILASSVTKPIRQISNAAKAVTDGDYTVTLPVTSEDEMGMLFQDFNNMTSELSKVDTMRRDLLSNVSHELRTPLTMIKGYAETIRDLTANNPEKRSKQLDIIIDESDRLSKLITNILDLSRLQAQKVKFEYEEFSLSQMVERLLPRYDIYKDDGFEIKSDIAPDILFNGDSTRIEQVICNLTDNAINHSAENSVITVELTKDRKLSFHNYGEPISPENLKYIWERYYRIDKSGGRKTTGTGIGLSIVKEILDAHKLTYGVTSTPQDGTVFYINF